RHQRAALPYGPQELADPQYLRRLLRGVHRPAVGEDALEADEAAGAEQPQRFSEVLQVLHEVAVAEDEVVAAVRQARQDVQGAAGLAGAVAAPEQGGVGVVVDGPGAIRLGECQARLPVAGNGPLLSP